MSLSTLTGADAQRRPPPPEQGTTPPPKVETAVFLSASSWTAASLNGKAYGGERPTLRIDDVFRGTGFSGCNTFSATTYPLREMGFAVGPVAVTRRACDGGAMAIESALPRRAAHGPEMGSRLGPARAQRPERHAPLRARHLNRRVRRPVTP